MYLKNTLLVAFSLIAYSVFSQTSFETAIDHLRKSEKYTNTDLSDVFVSDEYQSKHNGITHVYLKQRFQGIEVKYAMTNFNLQSGFVKSEGGRFVEQIAQKINTTNPQITASQALQKVMSLHEIMGIMLGS